MAGGGVIFYGTKDTLICGCYGVNPYLVSGRVPNAPKVLREIKESHQMDWVRACKEDADDRVPSASDFSEAGPFNEMVVMGVLAVRLQNLNRELLWDGPNMRFTNIPDDAMISAVIKRRVPHIKDGSPDLRQDLDGSGQRTAIRTGAHQAHLPRRLETARHAALIYGQIINSN